FVTAVSDRRRAADNLRLRPLPLHRSNGANGMNTPCWEAGGWTALVGGNPTERIGRPRVNDMSGNAARLVASERGSERVSIEERDFRDRRQSCEVAAMECGQRRSFKTGCCDFVKGYF